MPKFDDTREADWLFRTLVYGKAKARKTWWAATAASAGLNVMLFDGDDGKHIINNLPTEDRARIAYLDVVDNFNAAIFSTFFTYFIKGVPFTWDEVNKKVITVRSNVQENSSLVEIRPDLLTPNDVVIVDSWTALVASMKLAYSIENKIDMSDAEKMDWDGYAWGKMLSDYYLQQLNALPCHLVVIGHAEVYEKFEGSKQNRKKVSERLQPIAFSGPQGGVLAKHFSDVLYFEVNSKDITNIYASADKGRDGGSRWLEPKTYKFGNVPDKNSLLTFQTFVDKTNGRVKPRFDEAYNSQGFKFIDIEDSTLLKAGSKPATQGVVTGGDAKPKFNFNKK